jgi:hypothetical protein
MRHHRRRRRNPSNGTDWAPVILIGGGVLILYALWKKSTSPCGPIAQAQCAVANFFCSLFNPQTNAAGTYDRVTFPCGGVHAVPASIINSGNCTFTVPTSCQDPSHASFTACVEQAYGGTTYRLSCCGGALTASPVCAGVYCAFTSPGTD